MLAGIGANLTARADHFVDARYDAQSDELVVTMRYKGTNPNHDFTATWGRCKHTDRDTKRQQITAVVLDDQWRDAARELFTKTVRLSLADVSCRPAQVTLQTAPRYRYTVNIPSAPG